MIWLLSLVKKIPWQLWLLSGLLLVLFGWGKFQFSQGKAEVQFEWDLAVARGALLVNDLKSNQGKVTTKVETVFQERVKVIHEKGDVIVREVPIFVPAGECTLGGGFRLLHDAASSNTLPDSTKIPDAAPVPAQTVASTIADNYRTCHVTAARLVSLQEWIVEQAQLIDELCKQPNVLCNKGS